MLGALSASRSACFGGASGHVGAVFRRTSQGHVAVRLRLDEHAHFSPTLLPYIDRLSALVQHHTMALDLREGDGYIVLNDRWLHGRTQFTGHRLMQRIIGDPLTQYALPVGFQPPSGQSGSTSSGVLRGVS